MLRQRGKPIAALIIAYATWFFMDLNAKNIYEQIYYILCLIAVIAGIGVLVWFVDSASTAITRPELHESVDKLSNDDGISHYGRVHPCDPLGNRQGE